MTLSDAVSKLADCPPDYSVFAVRKEGRISGSSLAWIGSVDDCLHVTHEGRIILTIQGTQFDYLLTVADARQAIENMSRWLHRHDPTPDEKLEAILHFAEHGTYLPVGDYAKLEHAVPANLGVAWDPGAPAPVLIADEFKAILIFNAVEAGGGSLPEGALVPGRSEEPGEGVAVLIFKGCHGVRFGDPDEETRPGHPLWRMGFHGEGAFLVVNSTWVAEVKQLNETRPNGRDQRGVDGESPFTTPDWSKVRHYLLSFKDSTFECIAEECVLAARSVSFSHASEIAIKEVGG